MSASALEVIPCNKMLARRHALPTTSRVENWRLLRELNLGRECSMSHSHLSQIESFLVESLGRKSPIAGVGNEFSFADMEHSARRADDRPGRGAIYGASRVRLVP